MAELKNWHFWTQNDFGCQHYILWTDSLFSATKIAELPHFLLIGYLTEFYSYFQNKEIYLIMPFAHTINTLFSQTAAFYYMRRLHLRLLFPEWDKGLIALIALWPIFVSAAIPHSLSLPEIENEECSAEALPLHSVSCWLHSLDERVDICQYIESRSALPCRVTLTALCTFTQYCKPWLLVSQCSGSQS